MRGSWPTRIAPLILFGVLPCLLAGSTPRTQRGSAAGELSERKIERLIKDLGSDRFEVREAATQALMDLEDEPPALRQALKSSDAELRRRVKAILVAREQKRALRCLARGRALSKEGRVVEMVDRMVCWKKWDTAEEGWSALLRFADRVIDASEPGFAPSQMGLRRPGVVNFPAGDFRRYEKAAHPKEFFGSEVVSNDPAILVRGEHITYGKMIPEGSASGIVAASGNVHLGSTKWSFIVAGGDI